MAKKDTGNEIKPEEIKIEAVADDQPVPEGYTEEEWEGLSPTEKAGIIESIAEPEGEEAPETEEKLTPEQEAELAAIAAGEAETEGEEEEKPAGDKGDETPVEKKADEKAEVKPVVTEVADEELLSFKPVVTAEELPALKPTEEVIPEEVKTKKAELKVKYDAGDITMDEYQDQRDILNRQIIKHNIELENTAKTSQEEAKNNIIWKKEQTFFLEKRPEYVPSKTEDATEKEKRAELYDALSTKIRRMSQDSANANLTGMQLLIKADKALSTYKESLGLKKVAAVPAEKAAPDKKPPARIPDVKSLADVPVVQKNDGVDDSFAQIDKLTGEAFEAALERMSPAARAAYEDRADKR